VTNIKYSHPPLIIYSQKTMNYEITGKLIHKEDTQKLSDRFQKREFVIEVENERNSQWNDFIKIQLLQDRCDLLENIQLNENIKVYFNLRGRKWENNGQVSYFTNLEGWRIEKVQAAPTETAAAPMPQYQVEDIPPMPDVDDLPF